MTGIRALDVFLFPGAGRDPEIIKRYASGSGPRLLPGKRCGWSRDHKKAPAFAPGLSCFQG
ncbi:hypothetical protein OCEANICA350_12005 [Oceanicaulis sp. 350]|nr:hypothetical protein OCEANICA350_12005 [Oceanicaulis sp. 350]